MFTVWAQAETSAGPRVHEVSGSMAGGLYTDHLRKVTARPGPTCAVIEKSESEWDWKEADTGPSAHGDHQGSTPREGQVQP